MTKKYYCDKCGRECVIRSTNKNPESKFYRGKLCGGCNQQESVPKEKVKYTIPKQTEKNKHFKQERRDVLNVFFEFHTNEIKAKGHKCMECGERLLGIRDEIAHILPKRKYDSVKANLHNAVYLCSRFGNNCHAHRDSFENNFEELSKLKATSKVLEQYHKFKALVIESGSEKNTLEKFLEMLL